MQIAIYKGYFISPRTKKRAYFPTTSIYWIAILSIFILCSAGTPIFAQTFQKFRAEDIPVKVHLKPLIEEKYLQKMEADVIKKRKSGLGTLNPKDKNDRTNKTNHEKNTRQNKTRRDNKKAPGKRERNAQGEADVGNQTVLKEKKLHSTGQKLLDFDDLRSGNSDNAIRNGSQNLRPEPFSYRWKKLSQKRHIPSLRGNSIKGRHLNDKMGDGKTNNGKAVLREPDSANKQALLSQFRAKNRSKEESTFLPSQQAGQSEIDQSVKNQLQADALKKQGKIEQPDDQTDLKKTSAKKKGLAEDLYDINPKDSALLQRSYEIFNQNGEESTTEDVELSKLRVLLKNGDAKKVIQMIEQKPDAKNRAEYLFYLGEAREYENQWDQAIEAYQSLARKFPRHELADDGLAKSSRLYLRKKNYTAALNLLNEILQDYPKGDRVDDALYYLARVFTESRKFFDTKMARLYLKRLLKDYREPQEKGNLKLAPKRVSPFVVAAKGLWKSLP